MTLKGASPMRKTLSLAVDRPYQPQEIGRDLYLDN